MAIFKKSVGIQFTDTSILTLQLELQNRSFVTSLNSYSKINSNLSQIHSEIELINLLDEQFENLEISGNVNFILPLSFYHFLSFPLELKLNEDDLKAQILLEIGIHTDEKPEKFLYSFFKIEQDDKIVVNVFYLKKNKILNFHKFAARKNWKLNLIEHPAIAYLNFIKKNAAKSISTRFLIYKENQNVIFLISENGIIKFVQNEIIENDFEERTIEVLEKVKDEFSFSNEFKINIFSTDKIEFNRLKEKYANQIEQVNLDFINFEVIQNETPKENFIPLAGLLLRIN